MASTRLLRYFLSCVFCAAGLAMQVAGQEPVDTTKFAEAASEYHFGAAEQPEFELRRQPVMVWSNPAKYQQKGAVFVWLKAGRPQVIGTFYDSVHSGQPRSSVELHSLADEAIRGRYREVEFWHPASSGLKFEPVGKVERAAAQRKLLQLRQISREFGATLLDVGDNKVPLRLLPTPILTYEPEGDAGTDGAIFALAATGTDPDVFLIIENRKVDGNWALHYAFARFHFRELVGTRGNQVVWKADPKPEMIANFRTSPAIRNAPYAFFRVK